MKKLFITAAVAALFATSAFAADGGKKAKEDAPVSYTVQNQFAADFSDAQNIVWTVNKNFQKAEFTIDGVKKTAFYNLSGEFVGVTQNADLAAIPSKSKKQIASKYAGYQISQLIVLQSNTAINEDADPTAYFVDLKKADSEVLVRINDQADVEFFKQVK